MFLIFLEGVKITSVGLKLDRPQLQHLLLFLEHTIGLGKAHKSILLKETFFARLGDVRVLHKNVSQILAVIDFSSKEIARKTL